MSKIRVVVVEDSLTVRRKICDVIASDPELELAGEGGDGKRGFELCRSLRPDVLTLDMHMPIMTGLVATENIMAHCPTPILIVSSSINRGDLFKTYDALAAGAVEVMEKPRGDEPDGEWERRFLSTLKLVSRIKVITHPRARLGEMGIAVGPPVRPPTTPSPARHTSRILAIGASTGGPSAIVQVLRAIPAQIAAPMFVVLHIDQPFDIAFADWLQHQTPHAVAYARGGEPVASLIGKVVMAPAGKHMVVQNHVLRLTTDPERHSCRPSVDVLFESLAKDYPNDVAACLLTGMGRDGASGLLAIRRAGGFTVAQDEATSVVYGMPREAVLLDAAERVLPLGEIGAALAAHVPVRAARTHG
ncbi:MAG TPA: chemotaxis-specific protein-glutamate methyltransferase CheB [Polyangiaceae bacterium]|jgi:two-component system chemotaxis response regulator CheB